MNEAPDLRAAGLSVSRETLERLTHFATELERWSAKINLIAPSSAGAIWKRHIIDSAQLFDLRYAGGKIWCDLGSGGGLPAIVVSIIAAELDPALHFRLVESDSRKAAFLRVMVADLFLNAQVLKGRAETLAPIGAQTVSARALAPLDKLLGYVHRHLDPLGVALLPKGRNHVAEVRDAERNWSFDLDLVDSVSDEEAKVLCIRRLRQRECLK